MYLRVAVTANCVGAIRGCHARILGITKSGEQRFGGEIFKVPFAPGTDADAFSKSINDRATEYIDLVAITDDNEIVKPYHLGTHLNSIMLREIFDGTGEYQIHLLVSGDDIISQPVWIRFNWDGNWLTSRISCLVENI
jgi:hypothetical protein